MASSFYTLSAILAIIGTLVWIFYRWAWAWPGFGHVFKRPDLRGTWAGVIRSEWINPATGQKIGPIDCYLVIRQNFGAIHIRLLSAESSSITQTAALTRESDGAITLIGVYRNDPKNSIRGRSAIHHGALVLRVEGPPPVSMSGHYWTDRNTKGELAFRLLDRRCADDFKTAQNMFSAAREHPMTLPAPPGLPFARPFPNAQKHLGHRAIFELHEAAIQCALDRDVLLSGLDRGFVATLFTVAKLSDQILLDLQAFNETKNLEDGTVPITVWLETAIHLSASRREAEVFKKHLASLRRSHI